MKPYAVLGATPDISLTCEPLRRRLPLFLGLSSLTVKMPNSKGQASSILQQEYNHVLLKFISNIDYFDTGTQSRTEGDLLICGEL